MGNVDQAKDCFKQAEVISNSNDKAIQCRNFINRQVFTQSSDSLNLTIKKNQG